MNMNTKSLFLLLFLAISTLSFAQQKKFLDVSKYKGDYTTDEIYLNENDMVDADKVEKDLNFLLVKFSFDPEKSDEEKLVYIEGLIIQLEQLGSVCLSSPNLKTLMFQIGEQIFLTKAEVDSCNGDYKKMASLNLENAWKKLSPTLNKHFPKTKMYATNWGW